MPFHRWRNAFRLSRPCNAQRVRAIATNRACVRVYFIYVLYVTYTPLFFCLCNVTGRETGAIVIYREIEREREQRCAGSVQINTDPRLPPSLSARGLTKCDADPRH